MVREKTKVVNVVCPRCNNDQRIVRHGFGITVNRDNGEQAKRRQRYKCQNCAHTFYAE
jgi:transposase-like protein